MQRSLLAAMVCCMTGVLSCTTLKEQDAGTGTGGSGGFVKVMDGGFVLNGRPFYFMGSNFFRLGLTDAFGQKAQKETRDGRNTYPQIDQVMARYAEDKITVVRIWAFSCENARVDPIAGPLLREDMSYNEEALERLDYTLYAAGRHGIKIILHMVNYEPSYCGMEWWVGNTLGKAGPKDAKRMLYSCVSPDPHDFKVYRIVKDKSECTRRKLTFLPTRELFYRDPLVKESFKRHLAFLLNHKNAYSLVAYKDDPSIMAIEAANEPHTSDFVECMMQDPGSRSNEDCRKENLQNFHTGSLVNQWLKEIAAYIKSIDGHHLVSSGEEGYRISHQDPTCRSAHPWIHNGVKGEDFAQNAALPELDFLTAHLYPDNWEIPPSDLPWFDRCIIQDRARIAALHKKPIVLEETGFDGNIAADKPTEYAKNRGQYLARILDYAEAAGFQGLMVWQAAPLTSNDMVAEHDSFTFPIKTKNAEGNYTYSSEGAVVRLHAERMAERMRSAPPTGQR